MNQLPPPPPPILMKTSSCLRTPTRSAATCDARACASGRELYPHAHTPHARTYARRVRAEPESSQPPLPCLLPTPRPNVHEARRAVTIKQEPACGGPAAVAARQGRGAARGAGRGGACGLSRPRLTDVGVAYGVVEALFCIHAAERRQQRREHQPPLQRAPQPPQHLDAERAVLQPCRGTGQRAGGGGEATRQQTRCAGAHRDRPATPSRSRSRSGGERGHEATRIRVDVVRPAREGVLKVESQPRRKGEGVSESACALACLARRRSRPACPPPP